MDFGGLFFKDFFLVLVFVYFIFGAFLYFFQDNLLFFPSNIDLVSCKEFSDYSLIDYNGTRFYFKKGEVDDSVLVFYHGNFGSVCDRSSLKDVFESSNRSVIFVEYFGYSDLNNSNSPSVSKIYDDVRNVNDFILDSDFSDVLIVGRSLGTGPASYHSSLLNGKNDLILISPFSSLLSLVRKHYPIYPVSLLLKKNFDNLGFLKNFSGKLLIISAENDEIISRNYSYEFFEKLGIEDSEFFIGYGEEHNSLMLNDLVLDKVRDFSRVG